MKYDLAYVCHYLKALVIPQTPGSFTVAEPFRHGLTDDVLHKGIAAFRSFLYALFDLLSANKDKIDAVSGSVYDPYGTPGDHGTASLWHRFPVLRDITYTLFALGMFGHLEMAPNTRLTLHGDDMLMAICPLTGKYPEKYNRLKRMNGVRRLEVFRLLSDLGLCFDGADFTTEIDFAKTGTFHVTWDGDDDWALGLKLITEATANHKNYIKMENMFSPVFLRCNFHPLANSVPKTCTNNIREYALAQQPEVQAWIADMDTWLMNHGCALTNTGSETFTYTKRGTSITWGMVCIIALRITGCYVTPGVNRLHHPDSIIRLLPDDMVNMLKSGEEHAKFNPAQCHRRSGNMPFARFSFTHYGDEFEGCRHAGLRCQFAGGTCRFTGYEFSLEPAAHREWIKRWIELELAPDSER